MLADVGDVWDLENGFVIALLLIGASSLLALVKTFYKKRQKGIRGVDILQTLQNSKLFPIDHGPTWSLYDHCHDTRVWKGQLTSELCRGTTVYGCFSKVKGSSQVVLKTLQDLQKYPKWRPRLSKVNQISRAQESPRSQNKSKNSPSLPVQHDYVSLETDFTHSYFISFINRVSKYLQGEPLVGKIILLNRYWHREDNGCCWLLETNEADAEWTFYIAQPVEEMDQCLLTVIHSPVPSQNHLGGVQAAYRLGALQNYFLYRKIQCTPLITVSLPTASPSLKKVVEPMELPVSTTSVIPQTNEQLTPTKLDSPKTEANILQRFKNLIEEKKEWYEERKRRGSLPSGSGEPDRERKNSFEKEPFKRPPTHEEAGEMDESESDVDPVCDSEERKHKRSPTIDSNCGESITIEKEKDKAERSSILKFLRSSSSNDVKSDKSPLTDLKEDKKKNKPGLSLSLIQKLRSSSKSDDPNPEGVEVHPDDMDVEPEEEEETEEERMISGFRVIANSSAAEIMAEKVKVSNIDISRSLDGQASQTGGWIYCGLEKDVVILRKIIDDGAPIQSYLGKGIIPVAPKAVFEALKNPRTRFTYDEMLKKVDILQDFGSGLKIVYLYHEVSQLFRKETRDFCLLQSERIEGFKYIISMRSVGWPGCTEKDDVTRGKFHSSGWIIEPTNRDNKLYTMVTYIVQMELGMSKTSTGYLVEELAAKQPLSIAHLRQYLAPSVPLRHQSSSSDTTKSSPSAPMGTLAAAAAFASKGAAPQKSNTVDV